jgi:small subunit ribosomal protein S11
MANANSAKTNVKKKVKRNKINRGIAHVQASFNNVIITITDMQGNTLAWATAGSCGFKGARKGTPFAAQVVVEKVSAPVKELEMKHIEIRISGAGSGRESAPRAFNANGFTVTSIIDVTPLPHNGCRASKKRRV